MAKTDDIEATKPADVAGVTPDTGPVNQPAPPPPAVNDGTLVTLQPRTRHTVLFKRGDAVVARMFVSNLETGGPDQIDTGLFEIKAGVALVGRVWVLKEGNGTKTEHWALGPSYVWPSSKSGAKTYTYEYIASPTYEAGDEATFKDDCNTLFSGQVVTFIKGNMVPF